jgi:hypothetical protein
VFGGDQASLGAGGGADGRHAGGHGATAKATTRAAVNTSPEPFSNIGAVAAG